MIRKRVDHERRIILILAVLCAISFGLFAVINITEIKAEKENAHVFNKDISFSETIKALEVESEYGSYALDYNKGDYLIRGHEDITVAKGKILMTNQYIKHLEAVRILDASKANLAEMGLDKPLYKLTVKGDNSQKVYKIGIRNEALNEYYLMVEGNEEQIYMIDAESGYIVNRRLNAFVDSPTIVGTSVDEITKIKVHGIKNFTLTRDAKGDFTCEMDGETFTTSDYRVSSLYSVVNSAEYLCAYFEAGSSEMKECGLDNPDVTIEYETSNNQHFKITVGVSEEDKCYLNENDSELIYQIAGETYLQIVSLSQGLTLR